MPILVNLDQNTVEIISSPDSINIEIGDFPQILNGYQIKNRLFNYLDNTNEKIPASYIDVNLDISLDYNDLINRPTSFPTSWDLISNKPIFFDGNYNSLINKPSLFSGNYNDLSNKPSIPVVPSFVEIATGLNNLTNNNRVSYNSLKDTPTLFNGDYNSLINKPILFSGSYSDLSNVPTVFPTTWNSVSGKPVFATVATSGDYNDLTNKPTIPVVPSYQTIATNVNSLLSYTSLQDKPLLFDGTWNSLTGKPTFATVATSGSYLDLTNRPDLSIYATISSLSSYVTTSTLSSYVTSTSLNNTLLNYPTNTSLSTTLSGYVTTSGLTSNVRSILKTTSFPIDKITNETITFSSSNKIQRTIISIDYKLSTSSATLTFKNNNANIPGLVFLLADTTQRSATASSGNTILVGSSFSLEITGVPTGQTPTLILDIVFTES